MTDTAAAKAVKLLSKPAINRMLLWAKEFSRSWHLDIPMRIHSREIGEDGAPQWHPEFAAWISSDVKEEKRSRQRTKKAFRKLRDASPREFDAVYLYCVKGLSVPEIAAAMSQRAITRSLPDRYDEDSVLLLLYSGIDMLETLW
jgi:DNA-directed RNA polymerase specialized sigma24 family protein